MLPYERIINVLEGKSTDILPYIDGFDSMEAAATFFGHNVLQGNWEDIVLLEAELFQSDWIIIPAPLNIPGEPGIFCDIIVEDETHILARTFFGGVWYWRKSPYYAKAIYNPVRFEEDFEKIPDPDWEALRKRVKRLKEPVKKLKDRGYFVTMEGKGSFEAVWMLFRGLEDTWMDIIDRPHLVKRMSDRAVDAIIKLGIMVAEECEVDGLWITDDLGTQHAPYFSPRVYSDLFKENHRKLVDAFHDKGLKLTFHSHGNVMALFEDFVDVGFDSIDPLDEYDGMDLKVLKDRYGDKTTLKGGISCTIGLMKPAEIEKHVKEIAQIGGTERFILSSAGGVPPEMSLECFNTYRNIVQRVRRGL